MSRNYDMQPDLSPEDYAARAALLRDTIKADRFPLSPRIASLSAILQARTAGAAAAAAPGTEAVCAEHAYFREEGEAARLNKSPAEAGQVGSGY